MRVLIPYRRGLCLGQRGHLPLPWLPKIYLSEAERRQHLYVLGITGKGKSRFLEGLILQDILAGNGCGVIDPHADLVTNLLGHLAARRFWDDPAQAARLTYLNTSQPATCPPFNILATPGDPYAIAQLVIEAFRRTWPEALREAPQFSNIMLAALVVLIRTRHTLVDLPRLLTDPAWRDERLDACGDEQAIAFFRDRFDRWGRDAPLMIESTLNKVSAFAFNPVMRRMLGQRDNALDLRALMDRRAILLCDLSGEPETRRLLGSLLVTLLEYAAFTRHALPASQRVPFYLYVDEFQDFSANDGSAKTLSQVLSEARKFGLHLTLAHQSLSQLQARLSGAIGNIQTRVFFGMSRPDAEVFGRGVGQVHKHAVKDTPRTETQYPLYESLPEQWEDWISRLQWQAPRRAHVIDAAGKVLPITTLPLPDVSGAPDAPPIPSYPAPPEEPVSAPEPVATLPASQVIVAA